jgi:3-hydroxybutyryl-CoA dehydrogenase
VIQRITVLGAGTMGHGIAHAAAVAGYETTLFDAAPGALARGRQAIETILEKSVELGRTTSEQAREARARIRTSDHLGPAVAHADIVIEAVPEQLDLKMRVLRDVEKHAPARAILTSNTSSLSVTELAAILDRPGRFAGMHFFNPVHRMKLVEIVRALDSTPETLDAVQQVAVRMGKDTVLVRDSPGFVTSRVNALIGNEAFHLLQEGVASARDIDKALKLGLNHPMGPFELVDLVGLDTRLSVLEFLHRSLGEKFRPCPLLVQYVRAGRLGRKVGKGVYDY